MQKYIKAPLAAGQQRVTAVTGVTILSFREYPITTDMVGLFE